MTYITAIELENFQAIEARTRIELKPITLLYGPNSAGKSAIFDAIELLRVLLDPTALDENRAACLVDRWARRGSKSTREMLLAVEFPLDLGENSVDIWMERSNWKGLHKRADHSSFYFDPSDVEEHGLKSDELIARFELRLGVQEQQGATHCRLLGAEVQIGTHPVLRLSPNCLDPRNRSESQQLDASDSQRSSTEDQYELDWDLESSVCTWLEMSLETGLFKSSILVDIKNLDESSTSDPSKNLVYELDGFKRINARVDALISPLRMTTSGWQGSQYDLLDIAEKICRNGEDIMFFLGTMLWKSIRQTAPAVRADRRSPRPEEALTFVDLELGGWWATSAMSPSSPAALLKDKSPAIDEHFQGLAEAAHASLLLKAASHAGWGGAYETEEIASVRSRAELIERVNHHLERSLFSEKLYRIECASTLMVPIDLDEDDPQGYYALAQPAAVRLLLRDSSGHKVELQDVGSGVSYVLPVLYALSCVFR